MADFGLSKEEVFDGRFSGLKGTYGYMDPDYMSTNNYTKKSDIYSFGIILFELVTAINPQQGLMDYINLVSSCFMQDTISRYISSHGSLFSKSF